MSDPRSPDPGSVLRDVFGYDDFRPGQAHIIDSVLAGRDCIGVMPTGAGKSLTFQIPARLMPGTVVVLSPLISLMKDQVDALRDLGFRATAINSSLAPDERRRRLRGFERGDYELVYLAPEALGPHMRARLRHAPLALIVVDEAHCISQWGHDFRPSYRALQGLRDEIVSTRAARPGTGDTSGPSHSRPSRPGAGPGAPEPDRTRPPGTGGLPILALTATATRRVAADILRQLGMRKPEGYKGSFFRSNLRVVCRKKGEGNTRAEILGLIRRHRGESGIVYCLSRKSVEQMAEFLRREGVDAVPYHAGLEDDARAEHQEAFARDEVDVVVATIAFGMGIDKSNVRFVIHRDMPSDIESWYQEIGRAGRDGLPSDCVLFYSWADVRVRERFLAEIDDPAVREAKRRAAVDLFRLADRDVCRHRGLLAYFGEDFDRCGESCDVCTGLGVTDLVDVLPVLRRKARAAGPRRRTAAAEVDRSPSDPTFQRLRTLRKQLADARGVPAYIVFSDQVLWDLIDLRPGSPEEMLRVPGIGPAKLEQYGEVFLNALRES